MFSGDNSELNAVVETILTRKENSSEWCSRCRLHESDLVKSEGQKMLRCSRCKIAHYCSLQCQKTHFRLHKRDCKEIGSLISKLDDDVNSFVLLQSLTECIVQMGYRESDTVERGRFYYKEAFSHLIRMRKLDPSTFFSHDLEELSLLLLVVLGGGLDELEEWCRDSRRLVGMQNDASSDSGNSNMLLFETLCLLAALRTLALLERGVVVADSGKQLLSSSSPELDEPDQAASSSPDERQRERQLRQEIIPNHLSAIRRIQDRLPLHIRDTIPLSSNIAPNLFRLRMHCDFEVEVPYLLLQDCFFLIPGVNSVLQDFVVDDDYEDIE